jgi:outer membrane protein assembly factor BamB
MKTIKVLILTIMFLSIIVCCKKKDTIGPDDKNILEAYLQCPQTDIDWPSLADSPWPMFLHDPQHTSRSPLAGPQNGTFTRIGPVNQEIFSSPAITEDGLIIFGAEGVFAFDASGTQVWHFDTGGTSKDRVNSSACITSVGTIYIGCHNGNLYALNPDGTLKWLFNTEQTFTFESPTISKDGSEIYFTTRDRDKDTITLFDIDTTGQMLWRYDLPKGGTTLTSPAISPDGNTIYITAASALHAFNTSGQLQWTFDTYRAIGIPVIDNNGNIYFNSGYYICSVSPNGSLRWSLYSLMATYTAPCIGYEGYLYTYKYKSSSEGSSESVCALDYAGQVRWEFELNYLAVWVGASSPSIDVYGNIYIGLCINQINDDNVNLLALTKDGEELFELVLDTPGQYMADIDNSPVIGGNGIIYTGSDNARGYYLFVIE